MSSRFLLQIVDSTSGVVVQFEPGREAELDFIEACVAAVLSQAPSPATYADFVEACARDVEARGVGVGRSTAHVVQAVRDGVSAVILKGGFDNEIQEIHAATERRLRAGLAEVFMGLKRKIRPR